MKITISDKPITGHDHLQVFADGRPIGYKGLVSGKLGLIYCPACDRENYAMNVSSGQCTWCGWDLNKEAAK